MMQNGMAKGEDVRTVIDICMRLDYSKQLLRYSVVLAKIVFMVDPMSW
jgi:hypothetical protein